MARSEASHAPVRTVLLWDSDEPAPSGQWQVVLWSGFAKSDSGAVSITDLVEQHAEELRGRYLAFVHDLGISVVDGERLVDRLEIRPGFSYWWMTLLTHTPNYYEAKPIADAIKCLALEAFYLPTVPGAAIRLASANHVLREVVREFCAASGRRFDDEPASDAVRAPAPARTPLLVRLRRQLAPALKLAAALRLRRPRGATRGEASLCFIDHLVHLKPEAYSRRVFASHYWGTLPDLVDSAGVAANWLHNYYAHRELPTVASATRLTAAFEANSRHGRHVLLDASLDISVLAAAVRLYTTVTRRARALRFSPQHFMPRGSCFCLWPLLQGNWIESIRGATALRNCVRLALYERVFATLPTQTTGVYILENQPWEMALLYAWRAAGHGRIIGMPHATVRFWDMRYFYDARSYARGRNALPMPDLLAVNGPVTRQVYVDAGYPEDQLKDVEALRYLHLLDRPRPANVPGDRVRRVLICGDNFPGWNERLMGVIQQAERGLSPPSRYVFKPHKAGAFDASPYSDLDLRVEEGSLAQMIADCDIVLTGASSAGVDAYCAGRRVAALRDGQNFNASPLRGLPGCEWFDDDRDLRAILRSVEPGGQGGALARPRAPYFWLHRDLPRWRSLLGLESPKATQ